MKYLICSDIHGSAEACQKVIEQFNSLKCDYIILLGDILYHGPRNEIPYGHNPQEAAMLLNKYADRIIACRGNCDCEVDQMLLNFPITQDYSLLLDDGIKIFATHGHLFTPDDAKLSYDVYFSGHTHIQVLERSQHNAIICNPGSVSLPKAQSSSGFAVYEDNCVMLYDLEGTKLKTMSL
ncbi:MAG: phosphodiesterase [Treponema sp.]|nr:phosphodiesterase [Treponema sp.]